MFNLDIITDEDAKAPFVFQLAGKKWRVPHVADLTLGQQVSLDGNRIADVLREVAEFENVDGWWPARGEIAGAVLALKGPKVGKFLAAWLAHAGVEPGESPASSR